MMTENIFVKAMELKTGERMILSFTTKEKRNGNLILLKKWQRTLIKDYDSEEAAQISIEKEDGPDGKFLTKIFKDPVIIDSVIIKPDGSKIKIDLNPKPSDEIPLF